MTKEEKQNILMLQSQGLGYKRIAATLEISENTVKSFLKRADKGPEIFHAPETPSVDDEKHRCRQCGKPVQQIPGRKKKKFCSDACRYRWWNAHPAKDADRICPVCGERFTAYGRRSRKYCSHTCYILDRFGGVACE